jgi:Asp-tRNA(Asn)/Glu-tRNA(Gln) amidotransferase A subunit family amidase
MSVNSQILQLSDEFRSRRLSPLEVAPRQLSAIEERDREANAFCLVDPSATRIRG